MAAKVRISVADDEPDMREYFQRILPRLGHEVVSVAANGRELVEQCREHRPDLVITDIKMPEMDGIDAAMQIYRDHAIPVIVVSAFHSRELIERAEGDHIMGYLVKPIKQADLEPVIALALKRFREFENIKQEATDLRQALEDRKLVERAKGILMRCRGLDEQAAFRRLQRLSNDKNLRMADVARSLVLAEEALQTAE